MSAGVALWQEALARQPGFVRELKSTAQTRSIDDADGESSEAMERKAAVVVDPFTGVDDRFDDESNDDDPFADFDPEFENTEKESIAGAERTECAGHDVDGVPRPVVEHNFEEQADLWLTRSHTSLEHALLSLGLTRDVLPTKRPVLVFGSRREELRDPEYHGVEVRGDHWPTRIHSTSRLSATDAAKILASSETVTRSMMGVGFSGDTVAVEVPNPLVAEDRWIVIWPRLAALPTRDSIDILSQWRHVRRVVWWVNKDQIGPRDTLGWLSRDWPEVPVRVALFGATFFVHGEGDTAQSRVLPRVRRALSKFESLRSSPWVVAGP